MVAEVSLDSPPEISAMGIPRHGEATHMDQYLLPNHWCFHIYGYQGVLELNDESHEIQPGYSSLIPPGVRMVYRYCGPSEHVYCHFKLKNGNSQLRVPMVMSLGSHYESMDRRARLAVIRGTTDMAYSISAFWTLLWEYADLSSGKAESHPSVGHPLVSAAILHLEQRLSIPISVRGLCEEIGVSYGYLTRLFSRHLGLSVSEYIRKRRAAQAYHLLTSTNMPIKSIAQAVGIPRLTQFYKLMHYSYGHGPRDLRSHYEFIEPKSMSTIDGP
ncbi:MAG: helix-turn-helix domain-containing protein [Armatimonadetes bacterium]|nr:helix-turn-helix domain-containing protein [Armatimonadota bacterium]